MSFFTFEEEIAKAFAEKAVVADNIEGFKEKYDTVVGESGEVIEARVEKTADGQAKMTFDTTDFKSIYSIVTVVDENKLDENLARNLGDKGFITGSVMRDTKNVTCVAHWYSLVLAIIVAFLSFITRKKQPLFYIIAAVGFVLSVLIAIIGTCFIDWLAIGMMALLIAGVYLISLEKEEKAK